MKVLTISLDLGEFIERFQVIFDFPSGSEPNAVQRTRLNSLQRHLGTFKTIKDNVAGASSPDTAELTTFFNDLATLKDTIIGISEMPVPSSPLIPSSAPSPLGLSDIQTYAGNIQTYIDDFLNSTLGLFFTTIYDPGAGDGVMEHTNAEIRYYLNIGLPLLLESATRESSFKVPSIMSAPSSSERRDRMANSIRSWMKIQWKGSAIQASAMNTRIEGLSLSNETQWIAGCHVAMLTDDRPSNPDVTAAINPRQEFQNHIINRPII